MKLIENYIPKTEIEYNKLYQKSIEDPNSFWSDIASTFTWKKKWNKTFEFDFKKPDFKWFLDGKLNITENCLDRHLTKKAEKTAIIFEPNDPTEKCLRISYRELYSKVCKFSNVLKKNNIAKGDRVCLYMPMVPELAIAV